MDDDILLNIYDDTSHLRTGEANLKDDLLPCGERYKDLEKLTSGGMKNVLKCYDSHTDSQVILVTPKDEELYDSFIREGRIMSFLQHPNIMSVCDMGVMADAVPFFTMKYCAGEDFDSYLKKDHSLPEKLSHFIKVCDAMNYAHSRGVIHLDLKPANIRIGQYGEVLVGDWGIAELNYEIDDADESYLDKDLQKILLYRKPVDAKVLSGTPGYIAPERYKNSGPAVTSDIFSLGAILYEILTGASPDSTEYNFTEDYPAGIVAICRKALEESVEKRYSSMSELVLDLNRYTLGFATKAENAGLVRQLKLLYQRNRRFCLLLLCSILLLSLSITISFFRISESRQVALTEKEAAFRAKQETEKLVKELQGQQQKNVALMNLAGENHLVIARQKLIHQLFKECEANFALAKELSPDAKEIRHFGARLKFAKMQWEQAEKLFSGLENVHAVKLIKRLKTLNSKQLAAQLPEIYKFLGRFFMIYFLENCLQTEGDLQLKKTFYLWNLKERHLGMRYFPRVTASQGESGVEVVFRQSLAVKSVGPVKYLNPAKIDLSGSGLIYETGLNNCEDLVELNISGTGMLGAGALKLSKLKKINVSYTSFNDSSQFEGMPSLEEIDISFTRVKNFEGFKSLVKLKMLIVDASQFKNARVTFPNLKIVIKK